jgi:hypothetical protein
VLISLSRPLIYPPIHPYPAPICAHAAGATDHPCPCPCPRRRRHSW